MRLGNYEALWLLWMLPILTVVYGYGFYRKRRALKIFADNKLLRRININVSVKRQVTKAALLLTAALAIIIAMTQPGWNPRPEKIQRRGRDVVVLLDVSRSMLAEDIYPNRLERAKLELNELLAELDGDRVGIVAFAGSNTVVCPLTQDYGFVRLAMADVGPDSVGQGGTLIGDAIRKAVDEVFDQQQRDYKDIILITDGEDHESFPDKAAQKAAQEGVRIFAIGLGDENEGKRIPITTPDGKKTFLTYQGKEIWSKLDGDMLRKIAFTTSGGKYLPVKTGNFNLVDFYRELIAPSEKKELESTTIVKYDERFQIFLVLALGLLVIEALTSERKKN
ncbi:MAG: VWA domain-containing protein [Sedimentisphaerales bacterium]|nr:VWA domain-containing protein [Sedimentisphaerales bacterium]